MGAPRAQRFVDHWGIHQRFNNILNPKTIANPFYIRFQSEPEPSRNRQPLDFG
jgi:hypothetical protein